MDCETKIKTYIQRVIDGTSSSVTFIRKSTYAGRLEVEVNNYGVRVGSSYGGYSLYKMKPTEIKVWTDSHGDVRIGNKHDYSFANMGKEEPKVYY